MNFRFRALLSSSVDSSNFFGSSVCLTRSASVGMGDSFDGLNRAIFSKGVILICKEKNV